METSTTTTNKMAAVNNQEMDYAIKPEAVNPTISTEDWPLLLKNYDKCSSFTPEQSLDYG